MTIRDASLQLTSTLQTIYEEREAATIADWVMERVSGLKKSERLITRVTALTSEQELLWSQIRDRLMKHEPIQYILNEAWFCGLRFYVDARVLIPRPETEELVEWIISNCKFPVDRLSILDIGTGSGCIPITLKRKLKKPEVWSCDTSEDALEVARMNADRLGVGIHFLHMDFLTGAAGLGRFNIIVSNPPYVPLQERDQLRSNVRDHEPGLALFVPDADPHIFYKKIAEFGKNHLEKEGTIYVEIPETAGAPIRELFDSAGYRTELKKDLQGKDRMVRAIMDSSRK